MPNFIIYCDGACSGNPGPGGAAYHITIGGQLLIERGHHVPNTTNNRMELTALLLALEEIAKRPFANAADTTYEIRSDSKYLLDGCKSWLASWKKKGWRKSDRKPVENKDLWMMLDTALAALSATTITYTWIKGHNDDEINNHVDELAVAASLQKTTLPLPPEFTTWGPLTGPRKIELTTEQVKDYTTWEKPTGPLSPEQIEAQARANKGIIKGLIKVELDELFDIPDYQRMALLEERLVSYHASLTGMSYQIISGKGQELTLELTGEIHSCTHTGPYVLRRPEESIADFFERARLADNPA